MTAPIGLLFYGQGRELSGISRYTQDLWLALEKVGVSPTVLQAGGHQHGCDAIPLPGASLLPALLTLGQLEIAWLSRKHHIHLIHDRTGTAPLFLSRPKRISTIDDVIPYTFPSSSTRLDWLIYHYWLPLAVHRLDAIITDSQQSKLDIIQHLSVQPEKINVVPLSANAHYQPLPSEEIQSTLVRLKIQSPYVLYVGSAAVRKNVPRLVEAYALLNPSIRKPILVIAGGGDWKHSPTHKTVEQLGLTGCVHFTGYVDEEDLPALYNGADLFVFPSLYEGFGLSVLEAMACGTPVITSNTTSLPEVAGDAALLVEPTFVEAIAESMRRVLENPELATELRAKGLERARQFTAERTARETVKVYEKVLGKKILD